MMRQWLRNRRRARINRQAAIWVGRLDGPRADLWRPRFERWLMRDPDHRRSVDRIWDFSMVPKRAARGSVVRPLPVAGWRVGGLAVGAAAAVGCVVVLLRPLGTGRDEPPIELTTAPGATRMARLSDGSRVTLGSDTRVRVDYAPRERGVVLARGRARFAVAQDAERPFVVTAGPARVVALGTEFAVAVAGTVARVELIEGRIELASMGPRGFVRVSYEPEPGDRLIFPGEGRQPIVQPEQTGGDSRRDAAMLSFVDMPLPHVVAEANRRAAVPIVLDFAGPEHLTVTGAYRAGDTEGLARTLARTFDLRLSIDRNGALRLSR